MIPVQSPRVDTEWPKTLQFRYPVGRLIAYWQSFDLTRNHKFLRETLGCVLEADLTNFFVISTGPGRKFSNDDLTRSMFLAELEEEFTTRKMRRELGSIQDMRADFTLPDLLQISYSTHSSMAPHTLLVSLKRLTQAERDSLMEQAYNRLDRATEAAKRTT